uniref:Proline iminopeptidase n=1 Tax=uncultured Thiotrichaceae bacterium TaxID=298394 RepID=A0A6S6UFG4_9GAMM|nr:MAG: Proline iminopeptidase (EC [uncultured Thiotrichaceae bacterium]
MSSSPLYPPIRNNHHFLLPVDDVHTLYVEECGDPDGIPVLFLHGGPGAGCEKWHRSFFDPERYRIILFDQRGCGRSTPHASVENNTTQDLVADIERIRRHIGIEEWVVFGGSWGSTLGLLYAQAYPERVSGLIVRGIFLARQQDVHWFYQEGAGKVLPDYWGDFLAPIPSGERDNLLQAYYDRLMGNNEIAQMQAAKAWAIWEGRAANLLQMDTTVDHFSSPHTAMSVARLEAHYFVNQSFLEPNQLLRDAPRLNDIPGHIIHGRYDMICPLEQAYALHQAWPAADLTVVDGSGHAASEPGIQAALVKATDFMADELE